MVAPAGTGKKPVSLVVYRTVELICKGKKVDGWELLDADATPDVPQSPVINDNPVEDITLIPYGCAPIRITYFPVASGI